MLGNLIRRGFLESARASARQARLAGCRGSRRQDLRASAALFRSPASNEVAIRPTRAARSVGTTRCTIPKRISGSRAQSDAERRATKAIRGRGEWEDLRDWWPPHEPLHHSGE